MEEFKYIDTTVLCLPLVYVYVFATPRPLHVFLPSFLPSFIHVAAFPPRFLFT